MTRTPLAWKNLTGNPRRLCLGLAGIGFAIVLMFLQNGFRHALLDSQTRLLTILNSDLVAIHPLRYSLPTEQRFPRWLLERAAADSAIRWAEPIYVERSTSRIRVEGFKQRPIRVIALPTNPRVVDDIAIAEQLPRITAPGSAIVDAFSKAQYGFAISNPELLREQHAELCDRRIRLVGSVKIGTDFTVDGSLLVSPATLEQTFPLRGDGHPLSVVDFGLIRLNDGASPQEVANRLTALAPKQWLVLTTDQLTQRERHFWEANTPIGTIFLIGTIVGFVVGVIVCYQVLFTNIQDSMPELATLKAMGYSNRFFLLMILRQSVYLAILAFIPATLVTVMLFKALQSAAGLPMVLSPERLATILGLTLVMCIVSGLLSLRKLLSADPATLF